MKFFNTDITKEDTGLIVHGVNCQGKMASGVAGALRKKWPQVYDDYMEHFQIHPRARRAMYLGQTVLTRITSEFGVVSGFTQEYYGRDRRVYANYDAIRDVLIKTIDYAIVHNLQIKVVPIGAGLGGLNKAEVLDMFQQIENEFKSTTDVDHFEIWVYDTDK